MYGTSREVGVLPTVVCLRPAGSVEKFVGGAPTTPENTMFQLEPFQPAQLLFMENHCCCEPERTCFLNFYTNSSDAELAVPLPDAIDREVTAVFRRSMKGGAERLQWSCRMQMAEGDCF